MNTPRNPAVEPADEGAEQGPSHGGHRRVLKSLTEKYRLIKFIGKGSFGLVYRCTGQISKRSVAIKVFRDSTQKLMAEREFEVCLIFSGVKHFVEVLDYFEHRGRPCLVFELLEKHMLSYISEVGFFPIDKVRPLIQQLLQGLKFLKEKNYVHGDLKPVNIMIKDSANSELQLKIIDMGGSMHISEAVDAEKFQTLHFRAPEVIIRAPRSEKVDMWSLGCVLAEMLMGRRIYPGKTPRDQIIMITKCQGDLPHSVLSEAKSALKYYDHSDATGFTLKETENGIIPESWNSVVSYYKFQVDSLNDVTQVDEAASSEDKLQLLSLLNNMLNTDAQLRCTPEEALNHEFFTGDIPEK